MKERARYGNGRAVEKLLLHLENIDQTIRLAVAGAFSTPENHQITARLQELEQTCPVLISAFLPRSGQISSDDGEDPTMMILPDPYYKQVCVSKCISRAMVRGVLGLPIFSTDVCAADNLIGSALRKAYARDFQKPNLVELGSCAIQWCEKVSFFDL
jgi:hypothetical protein